MTTPDQKFLRRLKFWALPVAFSLVGAIAGPGLCALETDDVGMYGSILISRKAHAAATAMKQGQYGEAQMHYKALIGMDPKEDDFYFGLYEASRKKQQWPEVALAQEQLFQHNPKYKAEMPLEYGECLYHMNKYSEAEPVLKAALAKVEEPSIVEKQLKKLMMKSIIIKQKHVGKIVVPKYKVIAPVPKRETVTQKMADPQTSSTALNMEAAYLRSECIVIAEYKGYEKDDMVTFYNPPKAIYRIEESLKGHDMNKTLPIRYEFHDKTNKPKPEGWKFDEKEMMPEKGSKWIIFIPNAIPVDGQFETYHGSYGRLEYNEDNYDKVLRILEQHKGQTR